MTAGKKLWMLFGKAAACLALGLAVVAFGGMTVRAEEGEGPANGEGNPGVQDSTGQGEGAPSQQDGSPTPEGDPPAGQEGETPVTLGGGVTTAAAETDEPYAVPEGSASFVDADGNEVTYKNDATGNAIQKAIEGAITSAQNNAPANPTDKTQLTIVVDNGVYQGGLDLSASAGGSFSEFLSNLSGQGGGADPLANIALNIVAKDALDENNNPTAAGAGGAVIDGDINIEGLDVLLAGLYLSLNSKVSVVSADNFSYYGTEQDDHVDLSLKDVCGSLLVDTGAGDDTLQLAIQQLPDVQLDIDDDLYNALKDAENFEDLDSTDPALQAKLQQLEADIAAAITGRVRANAMLNVLVKANVGSNDISVYLKNATRLAAADGGSRTLFLDVSRTVLDIYGGTGSDEILVAGGFAETFEEGLALGAFRFAQKEVAGEVPNRVNLYDAGGDNLFTADTSLALASALGMEVAVEGGGGFDRLHLTGQLDGVAGPMGGSAANLTLKTAASPGGSFAALAGKLVVTSTGVEAYTDLLAGKPTVALGALAPGATAAAFTNYLLDLGSGGTVNLALDMVVPAALLLANLIVKGGDIVVAQLLAAGLNVVILGSSIVIVGRVEGANVLIAASGEDEVSVGSDVSINTGDLTGKDEEIEIKFEFHEIGASAKVELAGTGSIEAAGGVYITAVTRQDKPTIPDILGNSLNIFTLKIAEAVVELYGSIVAGGSVWAGSSATAMIDASNKTVKAVLPFAVGAASTQSLVKVGQDASIQSMGAGVKLTGKSHIEILSEAYSGLLAFALGLSVAETETRVTLGGNATIQAAEDVLLAAASRVRAESLAAGAKPEAGKSSATGVYVAVNVVVQDTGATVEDNASIVAGGSIEVRSAARQFTNTEALSIPAQDDSGAGQKEDNPISFASVIGLVKQVLAAPGAGKLDKAGEQLEGENSPDAVMDDATDQAQDKTEGQGSGGQQEEKKASKIQLVGALAVNYGGNHNSALVNTAGSLLAGGTVRVQALGQTYAYARGDGSMYKTPQKSGGNSGGGSGSGSGGSGSGGGGSEGSGGEGEDPDPANSIGAGITVVVLSHHNQAGVVKANSIEANSIEVAAKSGLVYSAAIAKAGHVSLPDTSTLGLGGAIAVQVATVKNEAFVKQGLCTLHGGEVSVVSTGTGIFATVADASGKYTTSDLNAAGVQPSDAQNKNQSSVGVGAGIAVAVTGVDATAVFEGELAGNVDSFTIKAEFTLGEEVYSAAGAAGGKSVVPVLSLAVSGLYVQAEAGGAGAVAAMPGDVVVKAKAKAKRTLTADAAAVGGSVGVGASFGISILNDSAVATLSRSVAANNVFVDAESVSHLKETVKASAKGAQPKESPNAGTDAPENAKEEDLDNQAEGGAAGSTEGDISHLFDPDEAEADKFADKNTEAAANMAARADTKNVNTTAVNNLAKDRQRAETSEGNVQVAAAMALNIQSNTSLAQIVGGLVVVARPNNGKGGEIAVRSLSDTDAIISANASATNSTTGVGVAVAINIVTYKNKAYIGDSRLQAAALNVTADIVDSNSAAALDKVLQELVAFLKDTYGTDELVKQLLKYQGEDEAFKALVRAHLLTLQDDDGKFIYSAAEADELNAAVEAVDKAVAAALIEKLMGGQVGEVGGTVLGAVADEFMAQLQGVLQQEDFFSNLIFNLKDGSNANPFQSIVDSIQNTGRAVKELGDMLVRAMAIRSGGNNEMDGLGHKISTQAISGVGAANVGIAGSLALSVVNGTTEAVIAGGSGAADDIAVDGDVVIRADGTQKVYTTASASADKSGMAEKNKTGDGAKKQDGTSVGIGASVAISIVNVNVLAELEGGRSLVAATLQVLANARSDVDTISVAGGDPIARRTELAQNGQNTGANNTSTKDIAVDASVALTILTNTITARVAAGTEVDLSRGGNTIDTGLGTAGAPELVNFYVAALQQGETYTAASGFVTAGEESKAAVGAAVAVNLAVSDVQAIFAGTGTVAGIAKVYASTYDRDEAAALATVTGNSLDRYLDKLNSIEKWLNKAGGSGGSGGTGGSKPNNTSSSIVEKLNALLGKLNAEKQGESGQSSGGQTEPDKKAEDGQTLMSNVLGRLGVTAPGLPDTGKADEQLGQHGDTDATGQPYDETAEKGQSVNIAAAVAVNVTKHAASAIITGALQAQAIRLLAENHGNFRTLATGATILPGAANANCISAGVAVTVNNNEANTQAGGTLTAANAGEIAVHSELTQNMDKPYNGLLGAQALAGSVAGKGGKVGVAGAIAIMVAHAKTTAVVNAGAQLTGGDISVVALDKSKFAVRAGAITVTGASAGIGASFALVYARSETLAQLGDGVVINAASLKLLAQRVEVNIDDYEFPFDVTDLVTVQEKGTSFAGEKGLIHIVANTSDDQEAEAGDENTVQLNLSVDELLKVADMLNLLGSVNYYLEAIAGSVVTGQDAKAAIAGSVALAFLWNKTSAVVGDGVVINLTGDMEAQAVSDGKVRLIGGAVSFSTGKAAVGVNAAGIYYDDEVTAQVGNRPQIKVDGSFALKAHAASDIWSVTVAAAAKTGDSGAAVGGNLNATITNNKVAARVLDGGTDPVTGTLYFIKAGGALEIAAENKTGLVNIAASLAVSTAVAVGGTVSVIVTQNKTLAAVGDALELAGGSIGIGAASEEKLINILASVSGSTGKAAVAGTIGVLVSLSETGALVGNGNLLVAAGDVEISARADVWQLVIMAAATGSAGSAAVGATVNVGVFNRSVSALVGESTAIQAGGNILVKALAEDWSLYITMAGAASTSSTAVSGAIPVIVSMSDVAAELGRGSVTVAEGSVAVISNLDAKLYNIAGAAAISGGNAVGATVSTIVINNNITARVHDYATLVGKAAAASAAVDLPNRSEKRRGVIVSATAGADLVMVSVSGAVGTGTAAVVGVVNTLVVTNKVQALVGRHVAVNANPARNADGSIPEGTAAAQGAQETQTVLVEADDDSHIYNIAGGVAISGGTAGVGATVVTMVYSKLVRAAVGVDVTDPDDDGSAAHTGLVFARGGVDVLTASDDFVVLVAINCAGGSTAGVSIGAVVLVFESVVEARLGGKVVAGTEPGDTGAYVNVKAATGMGKKPGQALGVDLPNLIVVAVALAVGGTAGVTPVGTATYYDGTTRAALNDGAHVTAMGDVSVTANSKEFINSNAIGVAIGGTAGVAGTVNIILTELTVEAFTGENTTVNAGNLIIAAKDDYKLLGTAGTLAGGGTAAVGITGIVSLLHNTVQAGLGAGSEVTTTATGSGKGVNVQAESLRDAVLLAANASIGAGAAGVGINLMVMVAGGMLTQDAADSLEEGFSDPEGFMGHVQGNSHSAAGSHLSGRGARLENTLQGDGTRQTETEVGGKDGNDDFVFDGDGGYRSDDFDDEDYDDENGEGRGSDHQVGENQDYEDAANLGGSAPTYEPKDTTKAYIGAGAIVTSAADINVLASDRLTADLLTATASFGLYAGVGVGVAVAVLFSNVLAQVEAGAQLSAQGDITVSAYGGSEPENLAPGDEWRIALEGAVNNDQAEDEDKFSFPLRSIRAVSIVFSGGFVGVAGAVASVNLFTNVKATMAGDVLRANNLNVSAVSDYPGVLTITLAGSGGVVAVNASIAVTIYGGEVEASVCGSAQIGQKAASGTVGNVNVVSSTLSDANAVATILGAGAVAVNGGVALVVNRTRVDTFIGQGVQAKAAGTVTVSGTATSNARVAVIALGAGGGVFNVGVAIAIVAPTVYTYIGSTPVENEADALQHSRGSGGLIEAADVVVKNNINSTANSLLLAIGVGGTVANFSILLVFNRTDAFAGIHQANVKATGSIDVDAGMKASGHAFVGSVAIGGFGAGISVSYVQLRAANRAIIDVTDCAVSAPVITVNAGTQQVNNESIASATAISLTGGFAALNVNVAIVDNNTQNTAGVKGNKKGSLTASTSLAVLAYGKAVAQATLVGVSVGAEAIAASVAIALLRSAQHAEITGGSIEAGTLTVESHLNDLPDSAEDDERNTTKVTLVTGVAALISASVTVAVAYGRSVSRAVAGPHGLVVNGAMKIGSYGNAGVASTVTNGGFAVIGAGVIFAFAYAQGVFEAWLDLDHAGSSVDTNGAKIEIETDYYARAKAHLTPSAGGASVGYVKVEVNLAVANISSTAVAGIRGTGTIKAGNITVKATGTAVANAIITPPTVTLGVASIAANVTVALLTATQEARIGGVTIVEAGSVTVSSVLNNGTKEGAVAKLGLPETSSGSVEGEKDSSGNISISLVGGRANSATALANATNRAIVYRAAITKAGALSVTSTGKSYADATVPQDKVNLGAVSIGITVLYAKANGLFEALVDTTGVEMNVASATVETTYTAQANALMNPADGGSWAVSGANITTNVASATVGVVANAKVAADAKAQNRGSLSVTGALVIKVTGNANAEAEIPGVTVSISGVSVAVNVVTATLGAVQSAAVENTALVQAGSLSIQSLFNKANAAWGATAQVGSNGSDGVSINLVGGSVSEATATMGATVQAYAKAAGLMVGGAITVLADAVSYAKADITTGSSVSLVNVAVLHTKADAAGTFAAYIDTDNADVQAQSVNINVIYTATSKAATGPAGGVSASIVNTSVNKAEASTGLKAEAGFAGSGNVNIAGGLRVKATGAGSAEAEGRTHKIAIGIVSIAVNQVEAKLNANQKAYIAAGYLDDNSLLKVGGAIEVESTFGTQSIPGSASATVGGAGNASLSLVNVTTNKATATVQVTSEAFITNKRPGNTGAVAPGTVEAASARIKAESYTKANAEARTAFGVEVVGVGNLEATASTGDQVLAYVEQVTLTLGGVLDISSHANATAYALSQNPGEVAGVSYNNSKAEASVGVQNGAKQTSKAYIGSGASVRLNGSGSNLTLLARNTGWANAESKNSSLGLATISNAVIATKASYETAAYVAEGAQVWVGGSFSMTTVDDIESISKARSTQIGFGVSATTMRGNNTVVVNNSVSVGKNASIFARGTVTIVANSSAIMTAITESKSRGFADQADLTARNTLTRTVAANISAGAYIESDYGDVIIRANSGVEDEITTETSTDGGGFASFPHSHSTNTITSNTSLNVGEGATVKSVFGNVILRADGSIAYAYAYAKAYSGAVGVNPETTTLNSVTLRTTLNIAGSAANKANIIGSYVDIRTVSSYLYVESYGYAHGRALGVNVRGNGTVDMNTSYLNVNLSNADIRGYNSVTIRSEFNPNSTRGRLKAEGYAFGQGIGQVHGNATVKGSLTNQVYLGTNLHIYGPYIEADAQAFDTKNVSVWGHTRRTGIMSSHGGSKNELTTGRKLYANDVHFYLGGGAAGVVIDIAEDGTVRTVGLTDPSIVEVSGLTVTIGHIQNARPGTLILGKLEPSPQLYYIYGADYLYEVIIINRSNLNVVLRGITLENNNLVRPNITIGGVPYTGTVGQNPNKTPRVYVETRTEAAVDVQGLIANRFGLVEFVWTEYINFTQVLNRGGLLTSVEGVSLVGAGGYLAAPVWAAQLKVANAANVGKSSEERFAAWLFVSGSSGKIPANIQVNQNSYLMLSPVLYEGVTQLPGADAVSTDPFEAHQLYIEKLEAGGTNDLRIGEGRRVYGLEGSGVVSILLPGTRQYVTGALVGLSQDISLDNFALERYRIGYDPLEKYYVYELPNGTVLYLHSETGKLLRVIEYVNGVAVDTVLDAYNFRTEGGRHYIDIGEGVTIDLASGQVEIQEGYEFEALLSAVSASWLKARIDSGAFQFVYYVEGANSTIEAREGGLTYWMRNGTLMYYYVTGHKPTASGLQPSGSAWEDAYYVITIDTATDTMTVYELEAKDIAGDSNASDINNDRILNYDLDDDGNRKIINFGSYQSYLLTGPIETSVSSLYRIVNFADTGHTVVVDTASNSWYVWSWTGSVGSYVALNITKDGDLYFVTPGASSSNVAASSLYQALQGVFWTYDQESMRGGYTDYEKTEHEGVIDGYCRPSETAGSYYTYPWYPTEGRNNPHHYQRWLELAYWQLAPVSLLVVPNENAAGKWQIEFLTTSHWEDETGHSEQPGYISFRDAISGVQLKTTTIPNTNELGYRINEQLYISTSLARGEVVMTEGTFLARFDGQNYVSNYLRAGCDAAGVLANLSLRSGTMVRQEHLTDDVAMDVQGRYYVKVNGNWMQVAVQPVETTGTHTLADGSTISVNMRTTQVVYSGTRYLTVLEKWNAGLGFRYTHLTLPDGTQVDSDGIVTSAAGGAITMRIAEVAGKTTLLENMTGTDVVLVVDGPKDSVADGRSNTATPNITAQNDVTFISHSTGSIGMAAKPIELVLGGTLHFFDRDGYDFATNAGSRTLQTDTWLRAPAGNVHVADGTVVGAGHTLDLSATATAQDAGNITFVNLTAAEGSTLTFRAAGGIAGTKLTAGGAANGVAAGATVQFTAAKDIVVTTVAAGDKSSVTFLSTAGGIASDELIADGAVVHYTAHKDIRIVTTDAVNSAVNWTTTGDGDILFDIIEARGSVLALRANGGGVYTLADTSYLWADASCANPVLSAKEDIGTAARRLVVDIPASLWLIVERVHNYYIDAVELEGTAFKRTRPVIVPGSGRDEEGEHRTGDWLADADDQLILLALDKQSPEELTGWITSLMDRADWAALLDGGILAWLIEEKHIGEDALAGLLVSGTFTREDLRLLLNDTSDPLRFETLAAMLLPVLAKPVLQPGDPGYDPDDKTVDDPTAAAWLQESIRGGKVANLGDILTQLLTPADIQALIDRAWAEEADYAGHASNKPDDLPGRAFFMEIGFSDGAGWLHNVGDITVVQKDGEMGLGSIVSRRGNVTLTAEKGGMWGLDTEPVHVDGWNLGLHAKGSIGSAQQPVVTEQRSNRIVQLGNVIKPVEDGQGAWQDVVLAQVQKTDEHGAPVFDTDGDPVMEWVLEIVIRYSWVRVYFPEEATRLDASSADGSAWIVEKSGDAGLGVVNVKQHFSYIVPGSIFDTRTAAQTAPNITAGTAHLVAQQGSIGESALRDGDGNLVSLPVFIETDVSGLTKAVAKGSVHISDRADLLLEVDSEDGQVYALATGGIEMYNTEDADFVLGYALAGGDVKITGQRSVLPGDKLDAAVFAQGISISIMALNGTVGTEDNPMLVNTDAAAGGTLSAQATDTIYLIEHSGDVIVGRIHGGADVTLIAPGSITDYSRDDWARAAAEAARNAAHAEAEAENLRTVAQVLRDYIANGRLAHDNGYGDAFDAMRAAERAKQEAEKARDALLQQIADLQSAQNPDQAQIARLQLAVADLDVQIGNLSGEAAAQEAIWRNALAQQIADVEAAILALEQGAAALDITAAAKRQEATDALAAMNNGQASIKAAGTLTLVAGGSVGAADNWLDIDAGGPVDVEIGANSDLYLSSTGPLELVNPVVARHVGLAAGASLVIPTDANGYAIQAETANLAVLGGDLGSKTSPLRTAISELTALADNIYISNTGDLTIHSVIAGNEVGIATSGSLLAGDAGTSSGGYANPNVIAQELNMHAGGSIGEANQPLVLDVQTLTAGAGADIYISSRAEALTIQSVSAGGSVEITALGRVLGGPVHSQQLTIVALGDVGEEDAPLAYTARNPLLVSILGWVYGRYQPTPPPWTDPEEEPTEEEQPVAPRLLRRFFAGQGGQEEQQVTAPREDDEIVKKPQEHDIPVGPIKEEDDKVTPCNFPCLIPILLMLLLLIIMLLLWLRERKKRKELEERVEALEAPAKSGAGGTKPGGSMGGKDTE